MYSMHQFFPNLGGYSSELRSGYGDLAELKSFVPAYEGQGMYVAVRDDATGTDVYSTPVE